MTKVESLEREAEKLTPEELAALRAWFATYDADGWDRQIESDVKTGKTDQNEDGPLCVFMETVSSGFSVPQMDEHGTSPAPDLRARLLAAWRTNSRVTALLVERLPAPLWDKPVPVAPRRTVRMIAGHFHNSRSRWIRTLGQAHGVAVPALVDLRTVSRRELLSALRRSSKGIEALLDLGLASGGEVPPSKAYVWRNLPLDVGHVLAYFVAHEAHHRGQLVMLARQLGHRLPQQTTNGLWQWTTIVRESRRTSR